MNRCGLYNIGWNCYINSALQCLASCNTMYNIISNYSDEDINILDILEKYDFANIPFDQVYFTEHAKKIAYKLTTELQSNIESITEHQKVEILKRIKLVNKIGEKGIKIFVYMELCNILKNLRSLKHMNIDPRKFIHILRITCNKDFQHLFSGQQNDPHEFLMYLFDIIHNSKCESVDIKIKNFIPLTQSSTTQSISVSGDKSVKDHHNILRNQVYMDIKRRYEKEYSHFEHNICFYNINCITCSIESCNHHVFNVSPINILYLPIPPTTPCSIYDCMNELFKREYLEDYKCENCGNTNGNYIDKSIVMHPKMIICEITRYSSNISYAQESSRNNIFTNLLGNSAQLRKNNTPVDYPNILDISQYIYGNETDISTRAMYKLTGVICHIGSLQGGHYYAFCKNIDDDTWFLCDDINISKVELNNVLNCNNAYMLFYSLVD